MTDQITPTPELVQQWTASWISAECCCLRTYIATRAAQWGADQELKACCEWLSFHHGRGLPERLCVARRPKPPSLKEQALEAAARFYAKGHEDCTEQEVRDDYDALCRALEALPE